MHSPLWISVDAVMVSLSIVWTSLDFKSFAVALSDPEWFLIPSTPFKRTASLKNFFTDPKIPINPYSKPPLEDSTSNLSNLLNSDSIHPTQTPTHFPRPSWESPLPLINFNSYYLHMGIPLPSSSRVRGTASVSFLPLLVAIPWTMFAIFFIFVSTFLGSRRSAPAPLTTVASVPLSVLLMTVAVGIFRRRTAPPVVPSSSSTLYFKKHLRSLLAWHSRAKWPILPQL